MVFVNVSTVPTGSRRGHYPQTGVTGSFELPNLHAFWERNMSPLQAHHALLTTDHLFVLSPTFCSLMLLDNSTNVLVTMKVLFLLNIYIFISYFLSEAA